jgi:cysteine desulfuration protein SufE
VIQERSFGEPQDDKCKMTKEEIEHNFLMFSEWEDKYSYLIELGENMLVLDDSLKNAQTKIEGCSSQAWLNLQIIDGKLELAADADSQIVKGILAVVVALFLGQLVVEARNINLHDFFARLGLASHLSLARQNGLSSIEKKIKTLIS